MIKYSRLVFAAALFLLAVVFQLVLPVAMHAQQVENTSVISYQGSVKTNSGSQVTGDHLITATLYSDANGTLVVWSGTYKQRIVGGVFTVLLGSGAYPLPVAQDFSKTLWIGFKIDGGEELKPLTQLSGAPYSVSIADKSVTKDKMAIDYVGSIMVNGKRITGKGKTLNLVDGVDTRLLYDEATNSLSLNSIGGIGTPKIQAVGVSPWCAESDAWFTLLNRVAPPNQLFGSCTQFDVIMEAFSTEQMRMLGNQGAPSTTTFGILLPASIASGTGVIFQGAGANPKTYIHSFRGQNNFFAGNLAGNLTMLSTSIDNTGIGFQALTLLTGGTGLGTDVFAVQNTACGSGALALDTKGFNNTAIGFQALNKNNGGGSYDPNEPTEPQGAKNTACGSGALTANTTGWENTAVGFWALWKNQAHSKNTAIGACALENDINGGGNTAAGWGAMTNNNGSWNTAIGVDALHENTASFNTACGTSALYSNTTGADNTAIGTGALETNMTGQYNTASGFQALDKNTTGSYNTASGMYALYSNTTGVTNTASGNFGLYSNTTGYGNTAIGNGSLYTNTTGYDNTASGYSALDLNTTGIYNTASGGQALSNNTTGNDNTASGYGALNSNTTASYNTASGYEALFSNTADYSTAYGYEALYSNTTGISNTASGSQALYYNTTGYRNTASGLLALYYNTTGYQNTASGFYALLNNSTGYDNTASGYQAGQSNTTGSNNTFVGYNADASGAALTNATAIGNGATVSASSTIELGNASVTAVSTYGHIVTQSTITSPATSVDGVVVTILGNATATGSDVAGNVIITTSAAGVGTATFNFGTTYGTAPIVVLTPANSAAADATKTSTVFVTAAATGFTVHLTDVANAAPSFNYHVIH